jgi:hypothetical protein
MLPNLEPFYQKLENKMRAVFKEQILNLETVHNATLIDVDKKIAEITIPFIIRSDVGDDVKEIVKQQMVFNEYFNPAPFSF